MSVISRAKGLARRYGVAGAVRLVLGRVLPGTRWSKEYVWYVRDLTERRERRRLDPELGLRRGSIEDVGWLQELPADPSVVELSESLVAERLSDGAELWLATDGSRAAFCCWIFVDRAPLRGARDGVVRLPADAAVLEDSISSPAFRGRGVAPAAWDAIAETLAASGRRRLVTKVGVENEASRRAVEKAGFVEAATLTISGPIWRPRVDVELLLPDAGLEWMVSVSR